MSKKIIYFASELSACVGMNRFTTQAQAAAKIFQRVAPKRYQAVVASTPDEKAFAPELTHVQAQTMLAEKGQLEGVLTAVQCPQAELGERVAELVKGDNSEIGDVIQKFVYTSRGNLAEGPALDMYEKSTGCQVVERNSCFRVATLGGPEGLAIGGKVDGLTDTGELVEVKNRQKRLLDFVPLHERVQMHAYMFLTSKVECTLVQTCGDRSKSTPVFWDQNLWSRVGESLQLFHTKILQLLCEEELQQRLVRDGIF